MNGDVWRTPSGETGPEIGRQCINGAVVVAVLLPQPAHLIDWRARTVYVPLRDLGAVPNAETRHGGARGGRG
jgi:predicted metalloenzyme YecM